MIDLISRHLRGLLRFSGREERKAFWTWAIMVIGGAFAAMTVALSSTMGATFGAMEKFAAEHPDQVTRTVGPGSYSITVHGNHPELMPDMGGMIAWMAVVCVIAIVLLAAAVARRLHDRDRSGAWGLPTAVLLLTGLYGMSQLFERFNDPVGPPMGLFFAVFLNNLAYLASLGVLIILLAEKGTPDDNRFGPPPA